MTTEERLTALRQQRDQAFAAFNQVLGAIAILEQVAKEEDEAEKKRVDKALQALREKTLADLSDKPFQSNDRSLPVENKPMPGTYHDPLARVYGDAYERVYEEPPNQ